MVYKVQSQDDFDGQLKAAGDKLVIVDFYADWCGPCKKIAPELDKLAEKYADKAVFIKVNVDEIEDLVKTYKIDVMPTFIFIRSGQKLDSFAGANSTKVEEIIMKNIK